MVQTFLLFGLKPGKNLILGDFLADVTTIKIISGPERV